MWVRLGFINQAKLRLIRKLNTSFVGNPLVCSIAACIALQENLDLITENLVGMLSKFVGKTLCQRNDHQTDLLENRYQQIWFHY